MTENHNLTTTKKTIPNGLTLFVGVCPPLLPDEEEDDYSDLFQLMSDEIAPTTNLEWFAVATAQRVPCQRSLEASERLKRLWKIKLPSSACQNCLHIDGLPCL